MSTGSGSQSFQINPSTLDKAGVSAIGIGQQVSQLAAQVGPASTVSAGTDVASTLQAMAPLWEQHLTTVGGNVQNTGQTLRAIAGNYSNTETVVRTSFQRIGA